MPDIPNPGNIARTPKDWKSTKVVSGTASKDSLIGSNNIQAYTTSGSGFSGPYGGKPARK